MWRPASGSTYMYVHATCQSFAILTTFQAGIHTLGSVHFIMRIASLTTCAAFCKKKKKEKLRLAHRVLEY